MGIILPFLKGITHLNLTLIFDFNRFVDKIFSLYKAIGFVFFGYYIEKYRTEKLLKSGIFLAIIGTLSTIFLTYYWLNKESGQLNTYVYWYCSINITIQSIGVFLSVTNFTKNKNYINENIKIVSQCCFGIFVIHPFILALTAYYTPLALAYNPSFVNYFLTLLITLVGSYTISYNTSLIPFLKKTILN